MNSDIEIIASKDINNFTYFLKHWEKEDIYIIERMDRNIKKVTLIPKIAEFNNKEGALSYFEGIK